MPTISPPRTARLARLQRRAGMARGRDAVERQHDVALGRGRAHRRHDLVAAHQPRHLGRDGRAGVVDMAGDAAVAQHHAAMRQRAHLVELVRDEDDADALRRHGAQRHEQAVDLGRRQHRGRLVEDQDAHAAEQRLDDLQPLLLADRQRRHRPVGIERQAELLLDALEAGKPAGAVEPAALAGQADQQVVEHGKARRQMEMLVHHADAGGQRIGGRLDARPACPRPRWCRASAW